MPLVTLLTTGTTQARENAAGALWHLALEESNQSAIAKCNGISPLVTILDDGTEQAHKHAADALARLAISNADNQAQIAKHCVALLSNPSTGAQQRSRVTSGGCQFASGSLQKYVTTCDCRVALSSSPAFSF